MLWNWLRAYVDMADGFLERHRHLAELKTKEIIYYGIIRAVNNNNNNDIWCAVKIFLQEFLNTLDAKDRETLKKEFLELFDKLNPVNTEEEAAKKESEK